MTYTPNIVGIDTGGHGAICYTTKTGTLATIRFSNYVGDEISLLTMIDQVCTKKAVYYEKLTGYQGTNRQVINQVKTFKMGDMHGLVRGVAILSASSYHAIHPGTWQNSFSTIRRGLKYDDHKRDMCDVTKRVFPGETVTKDIADAMLIWNYGMRQEALKQQE